MRRKRSVRGRPLVMMAPVLLAVAVLAQTSARKPAREVASARRARTDVATTVAAPAASARRPLSYYTGGVRKDLFAPGSPVVEQPKVEPAKPAAPTQPEEVDPFVDYAYTGSISMDGQYTALIENVKTKEGMYLRTGDQFMGGTVGQVGADGLTITVAGRPRTLRKAEEYKLTPLDKSAPYLAATPGMPGMPGGMGGMPGGGPGGMPGMMGAMMGGGGPMGFPGMGSLPPDLQQRIQQRFQGMTPDRMQQMRNGWMNRMFEGGGRRRRLSF